MTGSKVSSEILIEADIPKTGACNGGNFVSKFPFKLPPYMLKNLTAEKPKYDDDGDLIIERKEGTLFIEHSTSTELKLVGLQVWRGAFLLADYILSNPDIFHNKTILELGSGVGLDSIIASSCAHEVICTDVNLGGILSLIEKNFRRNKDLVKSKYQVTELNFFKTNWFGRLKNQLDRVDIVMAADVIYDDEITEGFVKTLAKILACKKNPVAYVALEKRFVFTVADLDSVAPMYEEFLRCIEREKLNWTIENVKIYFPQFFKYQRLKELILLKIQQKS